MTSLPKQSSTTGYVDVSILTGGKLSVPRNMVHKDGPEDENICPSYSFLIENKTLGKKALFDLGVYKDLGVYTPATDQLFKMFVPHPPSQSLAEIILEKKGIPPEAIDQVIFSHVHWDHSHPFSDYLPKATALFGPGSIEYTQPGYPVNPDSFYFSSFSDKSHPWHKNVQELPPPSDPKWQPFGTFTHAYDLWDDGSFFVLNAPGHVPGNIAGAARLKSGDWVIMGGDCCHSRELLLGTKEIGFWKDNEGKDVCMHQDKAAAEDTIRRLRELGEMKGVHVALAHVNVNALNDKVLKSLLV